MNYRRCRGRSRRGWSAPPRPARSVVRATTDDGQRYSRSTSATGWLASAARERASTLDLPGPTDAGLAWFVREAWPSPATGTELTSGLLTAEESLRVVVEHDALVCFGDGLEGDRLTPTWGQTVTFTIADRRLLLVG